MSNQIRLVCGYDDQQGPIQAGANIAGITIEAYRDTKMLMPFMRHDQDDTISLTFQFSHRKKLGSALASIHLHYIPMVNPDDVITKNIVYWEYQYVWHNLDAAVPAVASWTTGNSTLAIGAADAHICRTHDFAVAIAAPGSETYSSFLLLYISRLGSSAAQDTYEAGKADHTAQANLCIEGVDVHFQADRMGSLAEDTE
jgi:hypothetical protein